MNNQILYSILIPAYNAEKYLKECLDSVLGQTHRHLQVIVIDDGSTDRTADILDHYAAKDSRLEVIHRENRGVAITRLELLNMAKGKYINFVDADDTIEPEMAHEMIDMLERTGVDMCVCKSTSEMNICKRFTCIDAASIEIIDSQQARREFLEHKRLVGSLWNKVVRRELCTDVFCPSEIRYGEDAVITWSMLKHIKKLAFVDTVLYHYRPNSTSVSRITFGEAKMTGLATWDLIVNDIAKTDSKLLSLAKAQQFYQTSLLLYELMNCGITNTVWQKKLKKVMVGTLSSFKENAQVCTSDLQKWWCYVAVFSSPIAKFLVILRRFFRL